MPKIHSNKEKLDKQGSKELGQSKYKLGKTDDNVIISLKYLDLNNEKFSIDNYDSNYFKNVLGRLKDISSMRMIELMANRSHSLKFNSIDFNKSTEDSFGLTDENQIVDNPRELEITRNKDGRVHGFCIDNVFYIRWFDPEHNLFESKKYKI